MGIFPLESNRRTFPGLVPASFLAAVPRPLMALSRAVFIPPEVTGLAEPAVGAESNVRLFCFLASSV